MLCAFFTICLFVVIDISDPPYVLIIWRVNRFYAPGLSPNEPFFVPKWFSRQENPSRLSKYIFFSGTNPRFSPSNPAEREEKRRLFRYIIGRRGLFATFRQGKCNLALAHCPINVYNIDGRLPIRLFPANPAGG